MPSEYALYSEGKEKHYDLACDYMEYVFPWGGGGGSVDQPTYRAGIGRGGFLPEGLTTINI